MLLTVELNGFNAHMAPEGSMNRVLDFFLRLTYDLKHRDETGATAVEYGLLVGLIAVVIIVAVAALGTKLTGLFDTVTSALP
jgi:pilus assembly protein Flp/PilA